jgi:hypothetical protein
MGDIKKITENEFTKLNIFKNSFYKSGKEGEIYTDTNNNIIKEFKKNNFKKFFRELFFFFFFFLFKILIKKILGIFTMHIKNFKENLFQN